MAKRPNSRRYRVHRWTIEASLPGQDPQTYTIANHFSSPDDALAEFYRMIRRNFCPSAADHCRVQRITRG